MKFINKQDLTLSVIAVLLSLMTLGFIIYSINFLIANTGQALNQNSTNANPILRFNTEGLKGLGIIK